MVFRDVAKLLRKNGWELARINGSHHQYKHTGNPYVATVPNHGNKDIIIGVIKSLEKGTGLSFFER